MQSVDGGGGGGVRHRRHHHWHRLSPSRTCAPESQSPDEGGCGNSPESASVVQRIGTAAGDERVVDVEW